MKLFTFYVEVHSWMKSFHFPVIVSNNHIGGFILDSDKRERGWKYNSALTSTNNLERDWPDDEIISANEVPDKHQLIEVAFEGLKE